MADENEIGRRARALLDSGRRVIPFVGDEVPRAVDLLADYTELVGVAKARAAFLGLLLAEQYAAAQDRAEPGPVDEPVDGAAEGLGGPAGAAGLVGYTYDSAVTGRGEDAGLERVATGEEIRALVRLEAEERDRVARLIRDACKIGLQLQQAEVMRMYASTTSAALRCLVDELGLDLDAEPVLRAAQRAGLAARRVLGYDDGSPDLHIGPALSPAERVRVLSAALAELDGR